MKSLINIKKLWIKLLNKLMNPFSTSEKMIKLHTKDSRYIRGFKSDVIKIKVVQVGGRHLRVSFLCVHYEISRTISD